jgi:hypothetical protein
MRRLLPPTTAAAAAAAAPATATAAAAAAVEHLFLQLLHLSLQGSQCSEVWLRRRSWVVGRRRCSAVVRLLRGAHREAAVALLLLLHWQCLQILVGRRLRRPGSRPVGLHCPRKSLRSVDCVGGHGRRRRHRLRGLVEVCHGGADPLLQIFDAVDEPQLRGWNIGFGKREELAEFFCIIGRFSGGVLRNCSRDLPLKLTKGET